LTDNLLERSATRFGGSRKDRQNYLNGASSRVAIVSQLPVLAATGRLSKCEFLRRAAGLVIQA